MRWWRCAQSSLTRWWGSGFASSWPGSSFWRSLAKIDGLILHLNMRGFEFSVVLPTQIKHSTMEMFETLYANLSIPPAVTAYIFAYAEFILPICLILGFATRLSALVLLVLTVLSAVYVTPAEIWTTQVYWISILVVLLSIGPGQSRSTR